MPCSVRYIMTDMFRQIHYDSSSLQTLYHPTAPNLVKLTLERGFDSLAHVPVTQVRVGELAGQRQVTTR